MRATGADESDAGSAGLICLSIAKSLCSFFKASLVSLVGRISENGDADNGDDKDEDVGLDLGVTKTDGKATETQVVAAKRVKARRTTASLLFMVTFFFFQ